MLPDGSTNLKAKQTPKKANLPTYQENKNFKFPPASPPEKNSLFLYKLSELSKRLEKNQTVLAEISDNLAEFYRRHALKNNDLAENLNDSCEKESQVNGEINPIKGFNTTSQKETEQTKQTVKNESENDLYEISLIEEIKGKVEKLESRKNINYFLHLSSISVLIFTAALQGISFFRKKSKHL